VPADAGNTPEHLPKERLKAEARRFSFLVQCDPTANHQSHRMPTPKQAACVVCRVILSHNREGLAIVELNSVRGKLLRFSEAWRRITSWISPRRRLEPPEHRVAFAVGLIALGAKMAKADGVVTMDEVDAFKEAFKVPEGEMKIVADMFNLAKLDVAGYETYAERLATMFRGNRKLLEDVLDGLFHIAKSDGVLHSREEQFLAAVAKRFGMTDTEFAHVKTRHVIDAKRNP
jgi:uncharacterized tellurite resistance protein B-like protein